MSAEAPVDAPVFFKDRAGGDFIAGAYVGTFGLQLLFAGAAVFLTYRYMQRIKNGETLENFLTARKSLGAYRIGWSFYAGAVGAWVITSPPQFGAFTGILGLIVYAVTSGLPIIMIAAFGAKLQERFPHILSASDFTRARFGPVSQLLIILLTIFNMSIALMAEYVSMGILFRNFLGSVSYGIIIFYGILTILYTAYGGLYISIVTDTFQGVASIVLAFVAFWYVVGTFRWPLMTEGEWFANGYSAYPLPDKPLPLDLGVGFKSALDEHARGGYSNICSLPISLFCATIFSEAMWQRCWASENKRTLMKASILGCIGVVLIVFISGLAGWLAAWAGMFHPNPNLQLFLVYKPQAKEYFASGYTFSYCNTWISVFTIMAAGVMSQGAVDSLQNGLTCTVTAFFFRNKNVNWARAVVVVINAILIGIAAGDDELNVLSLFLVTNLLTSCAAIPMMSGFFDKDGKYITGDMQVFSSIFAIFSLSAFGTGLRWDDETNIGKSGAYRFRSGMTWSWYGNMYDYKCFLVATVSSAIGLVLTYGIGKVIRMVYKGPGLNEYFATRGPAIQAKITEFLMKTPLRPVVVSLTTPIEQAKPIEAADSKEGESSTDGSVDGKPSAYTAGKSESGDEKAKAADN